MQLKLGRIYSIEILPVLAVLFSMFAEIAFAVDGMKPLAKGQVSDYSSSATYEDPGAIVLEASEDIVVGADNVFKSTMHNRTRVESERGKKFGQVSIDYNKFFDKIISVEAYTIQPDGKKIKADKVQEFVPGQPSDVYSGQVVRMIYMPRVDIGSIIEVTIKKESSYPAYKKGFDYSYYFGGTVDVKDSHFSITVPHETGLKYKSFNIELEPSISEIDSGNGSNRKRQTMYSWKVNDVARIVPEEGMPPAKEVIPWVIVSTFNSWSGVGDMWRDSARSAFQISPSMRKKVKELTDGLVSAKEKAEVILHYVASDIKYLGLEFGENVIFPEKAPDVFKNKYGDCKGKAALLVTLLREAGIDSYPVLIRDRISGEIDPSVPAVSAFSHAIVYCKLGEEVYWLDPTIKYAYFGYVAPNYRNVDALVVFDDDSRLIRTNSGSKSDEGEIISADVTIDGEGKAFGTISMSYDTWTDIISKSTLEESDSGQIDEMVYNVFGGIVGGGKMTKYEIFNKTSRSDRLLFKFEFESNNWASTKDGYLVVRPAMPMVNTGSFNKPQRKYPIFSPFPTKRHSIARISIPADYDLKSIPERLEIDTSAGKVVIKYSYNDNILEMEKDIVRDGVYIMPKDYSQIKDLLGRASDVENQQVIFEKNSSVGLAANAVSDNL